MFITESSAFAGYFRGGCGAELIEGANPIGLHQRDKGLRVDVYPFTPRHDVTYDEQTGCDGDGELKNAQVDKLLGRESPGLVGGTRSAAKPALRGTRSVDRRERDVLDRHTPAAIDDCEPQPVFPLDQHDFHGLGLLPRTQRVGNRDLGGLARVGGELKLLPFLHRGDPRGDQVFARPENPTYAALPVCNSDSCYPFRSSIGA